MLVRKDPSVLGMVQRDGLWGGSAAWERFRSPWRGLDPMEGIHGGGFIPMERFGSLWRGLDPVEGSIHGEVWIPSRDFSPYGEVFIPMGVFFILMEKFGSPWKSLDPHGGVWIPVLGV